MIRHGERRGREKEEGGVIILWMHTGGPWPECWPTSLTLFFTGHNEIDFNGNSIWMSLVKSKWGGGVPQSGEVSK